MVGSEEITKKYSMEEVIIYRFQLESIRDALQLTKRIMVEREKNTGESCFDRDVKQSLIWSENALNGKKDEIVGRFNK